MSSYDLLLDPINTVFAVNCVVEDDHLNVGAIYFEPLITSSIITLSDGTDRIDIVVPIELLNKTKPQSAWMVQFYLHDPS